MYDFIRIYICCIPKHLAAAISAFRLRAHSSRGFDVTSNSYGHRALLLLCLQIAALQQHQAADADAKRPTRGAAIVAPAVAGPGAAATSTGGSRPWTPAALLKGHSTFMRPGGNGPVVEAEGAHGFYHTPALSRPGTSGSTNDRPPQDRSRGCYSRVGAGRTVNGSASSGAGIGKLSSQQRHPERSFTAASSQVIYPDGSQETPHSCGQPPGWKRCRRSSSK